jgi:hypothetical protein
MIATFWELLNERSSESIKIEVGPNKNAEIVITVNKDHKDILIETESIYNNDFINLLRQVVKTFDDLENK